MIHDCQSNADCDTQVHGHYKEDVGGKLERPAEVDEAMVGQNVAAAE
jgi:small subunit ribosomal protein S3Ae